MNSLQRFYQWIINTPALFQLQPPFEDFSKLSIPPLADDKHYCGNPRLGFLYQYLCTHALQQSQHYDLSLEEVQINAPSGQTLGAIDLILETPHQEYEHWEIAIKFYLLHQGTWFGPNAHDQLDKKLSRMLNHQLKMSQSDPFIQQYPQYENRSEHLLMQGRLYVNPFDHEPIPGHCLGYTLNTSQISGFWCYQHQWDRIGQPLYHLPKECWAAGIDVFGLPVERPEDRFIHGQTKEGEFWFVVPDDWPNNV